MEQAVRSQRSLRFGVVGVGANILSQHKLGFELPFVDLVGVTDVNKEVGLERANELGVDFYPSHTDMLAPGSNSM